MRPEGDRSPHGAFVAALGDPDRAVRGITDGRGRPAPDRMAVYRNNVAVSLQEVLGETFETTRVLMGGTFFDAAAGAFAKDNRPTSPLLFAYGEDFPAFLAALPGLKAYPFVPEVAAIEFARLGAYHAADAAPLSADSLAALPQAALPACRFTAHPAARLVKTPAGGLGAYLANQDPPETPATTDAALITRPDMTLMTAALPAPAAAFASALLAGAPLGEAAATPGVEVGPALGTLLMAGAFSGLDPGPGSA